PYGERRGYGDGGDVVRLWRWWRGCGGGVDGGYRRVEESGVVDRVDRSGGSNFGLRQNTHRKSFPAVVNGDGGGSGGRIFMRERERR
ncbi:hypothetical protein Tco_0501203, partial [Tanacetum coccineum]